MSSTNPQTDTKRICWERSRQIVQDLRSLSERLAARDLTDDQRDELESGLDVLSIEPRRQVRILLSWGGPSDGFLLTFDESGRDLISGEYFYADWFTYAEESLLFDDAQLVADLYLGGDATAHFPG